MFTDWHEALQASDGLPLHPTSTEQEAAAARTLARNATSKEDLVLLLDAVGLPGDDDTLTALLPLLNNPDEGVPDMQQNPAATPADAFKATALSMYYADHPTAETTEATGLSDHEITALVSAQEREIDTIADGDGAPAATSAATPAGPAADDSVEQLLAGPRRTPPPASATRPPGSAPTWPS
ncbi:hypothetical protein [Streptomyces fumanus]|uniref:Uncharacterized protein n=1 Tax=Streptomyces fumanus TaxID=67302 RepID=A0A919EBH6_9ACTN|nr:hypothetical protein [Streptomyces fumanus]GHF33816.1 hypothetical protein GCM10018772_69340 [Streptomyces fumanus]